MEIDEFTEKAAEVLKRIKSGENDRAVKEVRKMKESFGEYEEELGSVERNIDNGDIDNALLIMLEITEDIEED